MTRSADRAARRSERPVDRPTARSRVVAELALRGRRVDLPDVVEVEQRLRPLARADRIERCEEGRLIARRRLLGRQARGTRPRRRSRCRPRPLRAPSAGAALDGHLDRARPRPLAFRHASAAERSPLLLYIVYVPGGGEKPSKATCLRRMKSSVSASDASSSRSSGAVARSARRPARTARGGGPSPRRRATGSRARPRCPSGRGTSRSACGSPS